MHSLNISLLSWLLRCHWAHSLTYPITLVMDCWDVMMEASAITAPLLSVFSNSHQCGNVASCPLINVIIPRFYAFFFYPVLTVPWRLILGEVVLMRYISKPGKLSTFHKWQKLFLMAHIWFYLISDIDICFVFPSQYVHNFSKIFVSKCLDSLFCFCCTHIKE